MKTFKNALVLLSLLAGATEAAAVQLVTDDTIKIQKELTSKHQLKNGVTVIVRNIENSDIVAVNLTFSTGLKDLPVGKKALNEWMWPAMTMGTKAFPKAKVFELTEKYALELGCSGGIEASQCVLGTLNDHWTAALPLFADVVNNPTFADEDAKLTKDRVTAKLKNTPSDPGSYINEVINSIYYPAGHPYRLQHDEALKELEKLTPKDLADYHKTLMNSDLMSLVVVTSMPAAKVVADLDAAFGGIPKGSFHKVEPESPKFVEDKAFNFYARDLPTAYIRIKLNAPPVGDKDAVGTRLMYEIFSEMLGEEIRTKRSLSYAVHSFVIQYSLGIGVISASTAKPQETIAAIYDVLQQIKTKTFTEEELNEYKNAFATGYFLTLETHSGLAGALASSQTFFGTTDELYDMPRKLDKVTAEDVKRLAIAQLADLRVGVIFGRKDFKDEWATELIKKTLSSAKGPS